MPTGMELDLRAVVVVGRPHGADDRNVVDAGPDVWKPVADFDAALSMRPKTDLQRIDLIALLTVGIVDDDDADAFEFLGILNIRERRFTDRLAGKPFVSAGFGSKLSMWLTPPRMNNQITLFALGAKCGRPSGGDHPVSPGETPNASRCSMAERATPPSPSPRRSIVRRWVDFCIGLVTLRFKLFWSQCLELFQQLRSLFGIGFEGIASPFQFGTFRVE